MTDLSKTDVSKQYFNMYNCSINLMNLKFQLNSFFLLFELFQCIPNTLSFYEYTLFQAATVQKSTTNCRRHFSRWHPCLF